MVAFEGLAYLQMNSQRPTQDFPPPGKHMQEFAKWMDEDQLNAPVL